MPNRLALALVLCLALPPAGAAEGQATSEDEKTLYSLGLAMSQRLVAFDLSSEDVAMIQSGFADGILGRDPQVTLEQYGPKIDAFLQERLALVAEKEKQAGDAFLEEAAKTADAQKTDSGLLYFELSPGEGATPDDGDTVKIHYRGSFRDGEIFDSSLEAGPPVDLSLAGLVPCFQEGLKLMRPGGKAKLICPPDLAYGDQGYPPKIPPGATLIFEIDLLEITVAETAGDAPTPTEAMP